MWSGAGWAASGAPVLAPAGTGAHGPGRVGRRSWARGRRVENGAVPHRASMEKICGSLRWVFWTGRQAEDGRQSADARRAAAACPGPTTACVVEKEPDASGAAAASTSRELSAPVGGEATADFVMPFFLGPALGVPDTRRLLGELSSRPRGRPAGRNGRGVRLGSRRWVNSDLRGYNVSKTRRLAAYVKPNFHITPTAAILV